MKKKLYLFTIILLVILFSNQLKGLAQFEFPNKDGEWRVQMLAPESDYTYGTIKFEKDTVINNFSYLLINANFSIEPCAVRYDSSKIYLINLISEEKNEQLLYDFNLIQGDSFDVKYYDHSYYYDSITWIVSKVDSVITNDNIFRKRILLHESVYGQEMLWIDGIGSSSGPLYTILFSRGEFSVELFSYKENGQCILGSCLQNNVIIYENSFGYYDPDTFKFFITSNISRLYELDLFMISGSKVCSLKNQFERVINLPSLKSGIYFIQLKTSDRIYIQKITVV